MSQVDLFGYTLNRPPLVLLDTNVLLLYLTGIADPDSIKKFKRTRQFSKEDFRLLADILGGFQGIVTTPNILTETSNLTNHAPDHLRRAIRQVMGQLVPSWSEEYVPSARLSRRDGFLRLGLTDVAITDLAVSRDPEILVLSTDPGVVQRATDGGTKAVNFTYVMAGRWGRGN